MANLKKTIRRKSALSRMEKQLETGKKTLKKDLCLMGKSEDVLLDVDVKRINKEVEKLKART